MSILLLCSPAVSRILVTQQRLVDVLITHRVGETCSRLAELNGSAVRSTVRVVPAEDEDEDRIGDWDALYVSRVARQAGVAALIVGDLVGYGAVSVATTDEAVARARARAG